MPIAASPSTRCGNTRWRSRISTRRSRSRRRIPNFYNLRGATYRAMSKFEEAILDYDHAIDLKPDFAQAYNNRGNAYAMQGDNARAIVDYDKAIKLVPNYASALQNRAVAHEVLGNKAEAIRDYRAALRLDGTLGDSRRALRALPRRADPARLQRSPVPAWPVGRLSVATAIAACGPMRNESQRRKRLASVRASSCSAPASIAPARPSRCR